MLKNKKLIDFLIKYRIEFICALIFLCAFIRLFVPIFAIFAFAIAVFGVILEADIKGIYYIGFVFSFRFIFRFQSDEIYLFIFLICVWLLIMAIKFIVDKKYKNKGILIYGISIAVLVIYILIPRKGFRGIVNAIKLIMVIFSVYLCCVYKEDLNIKRFVLIFISSVLLSSVLALHRYSIPTLDRMIGINITHDYTTVRFMGIDRDPNFYTVSLLVPMATIMVLYLKGDLKWYILYPLMLCLMCFGFRTISKSFVLGLVVLLAMFGMLALVKQRRKGRLTILGIVVVTLIACLICNNYIGYMLQRLDVLANTDIGVENLQNTPALVDEGLLSGLTTGRTDIWKEYFNYFKENPIKFIFGSGFERTEITRASHNTIIQGIYCIGVVGVLYIGALMIGYIIMQIRKKFSVFEYMPLIVFAVLSMALDYFVSTSAISYLILGLFVINYECKEDEPCANLICQLSRKKKS